jgi:hypothetical protein
MAQPFGQHFGLSETTGRMEERLVSPCTPPNSSSTILIFHRSSFTDIVEGVHEQPHNHATLHTTPGCTLRTPMMGTGKVLATDCDTSVNYNAGCGVEVNTTSSYGAGFNAVGGGVYGKL